ncbi:Apc15p protein [Ceratocystis platani]|uniref:Apc15p protein n=1 Tax=Ceratocystis fimbriata f. sp. platani TaxID=88771 RepID=A0A0F8B3H8_CERFI|nr:Apc15p protein [Ceratocystis platani]
MYVQPASLFLHNAADASETQNRSGDISASQQSHVRRLNLSIIENSHLGRIASEEKLLVRRRHAIADFGSTWLKPPAINKTLSQLREERREQEEHAEALRREQLQQELADAEAAAEGRMEADEMDEDQEAGEAPADLDDEIPDADAEDSAFQFSEIDEDDEDDEDDTSGEESEDGSTSEDGSSSGGGDDEESSDASASDDGARTPTAATPDQTAREQRHSDLLAARMREDAMRRAMLQRGTETEPADDFYGDGTSFAVDQYEDHETSQGEVLDEEDFGNGEMGMERDLDEEVPEAEVSGLYEHTDSDESLSSSEEEEDSEEDDDNGYDDDGDDQFSRMAFIEPIAEYGFK